MSLERLIVYSCRSAIGVAAFVGESYVTTQKGLRAVVGEKLFWNSPQQEQHEAPVGLVH
jgi:hypothetical protein